MYLEKNIIEIMPRLEEMKKEGFTPPFPYHIAFYTENIEEDVAMRARRGD
jgi:hypothetical protein